MLSKQNLASVQPLRSVYMCVCVCWACTLAQLNTSAGRQALDDVYSVFEPKRSTKADAAARVAGAEDVARDVRRC